MGLNYTLRKTCPTSQCLRSKYILQITNALSSTEMSPTNDVDDVDMLHQFKAILVMTCVFIARKKIEITTPYQTV